jgi:hypothetical protein
MDMLEKASAIEVRWRYFKLFLLEITADQARWDQWVEVVHEAVQTYLCTFYRQGVHKFMPDRDFTTLMVMTMAPSELR